MTGTQLHIDFTQVIHRRENTAENQAHFECNAERFSEQCKKVYELMMQGIRLTTTEALKYGIGDLRARVRDLIKFYNVPVKKDFVKTEDGKRTRFKEYSI